MPYVPLMSLVMDEEVKSRCFPQFFLFPLLITFPTITQRLFIPLSLS